MSPRALEFAALLIRNVNKVRTERETRDPLWDSHTWH